MTIDNLAVIMAKGFASTISKNDLKNLATKDDLNSLATKDDLNNLAIMTARGFANTATKKDLDDLAIMTARGFANTTTKDDLKNVEERLSSRLQGLGNRMDTYAGMDRRVDTLEKNVKIIKQKLSIV